MVFVSVFIKDLKTKIVFAIILRSGNYSDLLIEAFFHFNPIASSDSETKILVFITLVFINFGFQVIAMGCQKMGPNPLELFCKSLETDRWVNQF